MSTLKLHQRMVDAFTLDDLHLLCIDMGVDPELLGRITKQAFVLNLLRYVQARGMHAELEKCLVESRPHIMWSDYFSTRDDGRRTVRELEEMYSEATRLLLMGKPHHVSQARLLYKRIQSIDPYFHPELDRMVAISDKSYDDAALDPAYIRDGRRHSKISLIYIAVFVLAIAIFAVIFLLIL